MCLEVILCVKNTKLYMAIWFQGLVLSLTWKFTYNVMKSLYVSEWEASVFGEGISISTGFENHKALCASFTWKTSVFYNNFIRIIVFYTFFFFLVLWPVAEGDHIKVWMKSNVHWKPVRPMEGLISKSSGIQLNWVCIVALPLLGHETLKNHHLWASVHSSEQRQ